MRNIVLFALVMLGFSRVSCTVPAQRPIPCPLRSCSTSIETTRNCTMLSGCNSELSQSSKQANMLRRRMALVKPRSTKLACLMRESVATSSAALKTAAISMHSWRESPIGTPSSLRMPSYPFRFASRFFNVPFRLRCFDNKKNTNEVTEQRNDNDLKKAGPKRPYAAHGYQNVYKRWRQPGTDGGCSVCRSSPNTAKNQTKNNNTKHEAATNYYREKTLTHSTNSIFKHRPNGMRDNIKKIDASPCYGPALDLSRLYNIIRSSAGSPRIRPPLPPPASSISDRPVAWVLFHHLEPCLVQSSSLILPSRFL